MNFSLLRSKKTGSRVESITSMVSEMGFLDIAPHHSFQITRDQKRMMFRLNVEPRIVLNC